MVKVTLVKKGSGIKKVQGSGFAAGRVRVHASLKKHLSQLKPNTKFQGELTARKGTGKQDQQQLLELTKIHKIL